jgi:tetratricopeptide (TPR) repeat protein
VAYDLTKAIEGLYACGHALFARKQYADAAGVFRAMVTCAPLDERGWLALGMCHEAAGQVAIALEMWAVAMASGPAVRCAIARAKVLRTLGRDAEADEALDAAQTALEQRDEDDLEVLLDQARSES